MRSTMVGHLAAWCIAGLGRLWHCTQYCTVRRAPRERGSGSLGSSKVGGRILSGGGPGGLSAQRFFASAISSPKTPRGRSKRRTASPRIRLERMRSVAIRKAEERSRHAPPHGADLEQLAHLRGRKELLRFGGERR